MSFAPVEAAHFDAYTRAMAKGVQDKLFFANRVAADVYVDFGCSDGTLLSHLSDLAPRAQVIGYDLSELATTRAARRLPSARFFNDWDLLTEHLEAIHGGKRIALIVSSVLHEVYAYGGCAAGEQFWNRVNTGPFSTFVLRDMAIGSADLAQRDHPGDAALAARVRQTADPDLLVGFESRWGSIAERRNLVHFLLKYRYTLNWAREVQEDYLPITRESIVERLSPSFDVDLATAEVLPFLAERAAEDLGVSFPCPTHFKLVMNRR
jgi:hypothetical protein